MDSQPPPPTPLVAPAPEAEPKEMVYRTKVIQFLGRTTPIILQNDNGPCPLLAICNVLSLKNSLNLSPEISEVSQEKLLGLVAERLIDTNSNPKDDDYAKNQEQNISDAIDLLPRLTTGIDVNIKFRRIDDFEFTRECAIFDLLDIPLYHGWIVDPQDCETADSIGSKSYNTLMGELVALETQTMESEINNIEDDSVDFVAATTATLGVPSPSLSRGQSFAESPCKERKGETEEEVELLRILKLSAEDRSNSLADGIVDDVNLQQSACIKKSDLVSHLETVESVVTDKKSLISDDSNYLGIHHVDKELPEVVSEELVSLLSKSDQESNCIRPTYGESTKVVETGFEKAGSDAQVEDKSVQTPSFGQEPVSSSGSILDKSQTDNHAQNESDSTSEHSEPRNIQNDCEKRDSSGLLASTADSGSPSGRSHKIDEPEAVNANVNFSEPIYEGEECRNHKIDEPEAVNANVNDSEPIYEGEECILESGIPVGYVNREPVYEGEVTLAERVAQDCTIDGYINSKDKMSIKKGELIRNFLKNSASQLTLYGLFCLQDKVKERELCVLFRNNHFNTMFKYEGELYILATDQGYLNQPDLVWEKLNEVNGDTLFMTGNFKEFKVNDDHSNSSWDEQNAMDYLANINVEDQEHSSFNSDLQLAIALQQQEFEQQQQQQKQHNSQESAVSGSSRLVTGPQVHRPSGKETTSSSNQESKSKDKNCAIM